LGAPSDRQIQANLLKIFDNFERRQAING